MVLLRGATCPTRHMRTAPTLSANHIAIVIQCSAGITVTRCASIVAVRQAEGLWQTLITVLSSDERLASTFACVHVASGIIESTEKIAGTLFATLRVSCLQVPVAVLANIALTSMHIRFTMTFSGFIFIISVRIADSLVNGTIQVTTASCGQIKISLANGCMHRRQSALTFAHIWTLNVFSRVLVEERNAQLAMLALCIVLAIVANTTAYASRFLVERFVEVTACRMIVTITFWNKENVLIRGAARGLFRSERLTFAGIGLFSQRRLPR